MCVLNTSFMNRNLFRILHCRSDRTIKQPDVSRTLSAVVRSSLPSYIGRGKDSRHFVSDFQD